MTISITESESMFQSSAARVARHFPHETRAHIDEIMRGEYAALADRPIRMYVSNLVEHSTRTRLTREAALASSVGST